MGRTARSPNRRRMSGNCALSSSTDGQDFGGNGPRVSGRIWLSSNSPPPSGQRKFAPERSRVAGEKAKAAAIGADKKALSHLTGRLRAKSKEIPPPKNLKIERYRGGGAAPRDGDRSERDPFVHGHLIARGQFLSP
jgi:hypothetical protein